MSEVFMNKFEQALFSSDQMLLDPIVYWHRYVDDIACGKDVRVKRVSSSNFLMVL